MVARVPEGVTASSGVVVSEPMVPFLVGLRAEVVPSIPLHLTSGVRTATAQARALKTKRARVGTKEERKYDDLRKLYVRGNGPKIVAALLAVPNTVSDMAAVLQRFMDQGIYLSRHMRGDAFDLRVRRGSVPFNATERRAIIEAVKRLGGKALDEGDHIHVEGIGGGILAAVRGAAAQAEQAVTGRAETAADQEKRAPRNSAQQRKIQRYRRRARAARREQRALNWILGGLVLTSLVGGIVVVRKVAKKQRSTKRLTE